MAMTHRDFLLTDEELSKITRYFSEMADSYAQAREDPPQSVSVTFEFMPGYGRTVVAKFDGELNGRTISDESEDQLPETADGEAQNGTANESDRERLAKHGFFISEDIEGSAEADALAKTFADLINSMQEGKSDKG
jgi:hypothetical protein